MSSRSTRHMVESQKIGCITIIYDGECPFCSAYVHVLRLKDSVGGVRLVNARDMGQDVQEAVRRGYDLNEGMVAIIGTRYYHSADCIHVLSLLTSSSGVWNRFNAWVFASPKRAAYIYPILRFGRNLVLLVLRRPKLPRVPLK